MFGLVRETNKKGGGEQQKSRQEQDETYEEGIGVSRLGLGD
jgi:hypothetical protein